ncbi:hypothetical protein SCH4B_4138 [Ruegeria sp. TrichCH4B]|nr:hypothetical protein SCH4B_4138 [Ruegeria sp. TrichCH4B]
MIGLSRRAPSAVADVARENDSDCYSGRQDQFTRYRFEKIAHG